MSSKLQLTRKEIRLQISFTRSSNVSCCYVPSLWNLWRIVSPICDLELYKSHRPVSSLVLV